MWVPHGLFKAMENTPKHLHSGCWKPCFLLSSNDSCRWSPNSLAGLLAFVHKQACKACWLSRWPAKPFDLLICWPGGCSCEDHRFQGLRKLVASLEGWLSDLFPQRRLLTGCLSGFRWSHFFRWKCLSCIACPSWHGTRTANSCCHPIKKWVDIVTKQRGWPNTYLADIHSTGDAERKRWGPKICLSSLQCVWQGGEQPWPLLHVQRAVVLVGNCCVTKGSLYFKGDNLSLIYFFLLPASG